ncbi:iron dicitrate transporter FecR [Bacteroidales bacterium]|nr:iron dicitrate transporter FecR [Bacteroidales bacterium]
MSKQKTDTEQLLERYISNRYTKQDVDKLITLFKRRKQHQDIDQYVEATITDSKNLEAPNTTQLEAYRLEARLLLKRIEQKNKVIQMPPRLLKYAAIGLILLSLALGTYGIKDWFSTKDITIISLAIENGQTQKIVLQDGTAVHLNAGSTIRYPSQFLNKERVIELDGEAFIEVAKNKDKPFFVRTKALDIEVLGTSFNIKAYAEDPQVAVSVLQGRVRVNMPHAMFKLAKNEQLILDKTNGNITKSSRQSNKSIAWIDGALYFDGTSIAAVAKQLQRIYNCQIKFQDNNLAKEIVYGEHDNKSLESVLKSIEHSTSIKHKKEGSTVILYR